MTDRLGAWLSSLSAIELALAFCAFFFVIALIGIVLIHPFMRRWIHGERQVNDVVIAVAANYGLIYAVLLGLLTVGTFETTKGLQEHIESEASALSTMYHSADGYPEPMRSRFRAELRDYTHYVIDEDWPAQRQAKIPNGGEHRLEQIRETLFSFQPASKSEDVLHSEIIRELDAMSNARGQRLSAVSSSMPAVLWWVVIIGGIVSIAFLWMLHMDFVAQIMLGGVTALFLGIMTFLIYAMDHPLQGAVSVTPGPFQAMYDLVMKWDEPQPPAEEKFHNFASLGTGAISGVYYPVGGAICAIVNQDLRRTGVRCSEETTPGSVYNVDALHSGELEFGLVQSDVAFAAYNGKGVLADKAAPDLRSVLILHPELVTIVARGDIHKLADLAGKRINVGPEGSGTRVTWDAIGEAIGWSGAQAPQIVDLPADAIGSALCSGAIDAALLVVGHPSHRVSALLARCGLNLVAVEGPAINSLVASAPYWRKGRIRGDLYGAVGDTPTFGVSAVLMTTAKVDDRVVVAFARALVTHVEALRSKHPALAELTVKEMISGSLPAPLHPAAAQLYKSLGLLN